VGKRYSSCLWDADDESAEGFWLNLIGNEPSSSIHSNWLSWLLELGIWLWATGSWWWHVSSVLWHQVLDGMKAEQGENCNISQWCWHYTQYKRDVLHDLFGAGPQLCVTTQMCVFAHSSSHWYRTSCLSRLLLATQTIRHVIEPWTFTDDRSSFSATVNTG